jgi:mRNA interferase YafQ
MRTINKTSRFKADVKRLLGGRYRLVLQDELLSLVERLARDVELESRFCDHALINDWKDHRDCHLRPDLILIYRKVGDDELHLVRVGTHSDLGL